MLELENFQRSHFAILAGWFVNETEVVQWGGPLVSYPLTDEQFDQMLAEAEANPPTRLAWMICDGGRPVGHAQLVLDRTKGAARLARVVVAPGERGRGLALPMLRLVLSQAFALSGIESVNLRVYSFNTPAIRTYENLGFRFADAPSSSPPVDGAQWESRSMSLPRSDWYGLL